MFKEMIPMYNVDDEREERLVNEFVELGGLELIAKEYERSKDSDLKDADSLMLTLGWLANEQNTPRILGHGIHKAAIEIIRKGPENNNADQFDAAMSMLRAASAYVPTRGQLREDGALSAVLPYIDLLKSDEAEGDALRYGFRAASVVARLAGNDEQGGIGVQIFRDHPVMISKMLAVFSRVLDAGPKKSVLRMRMDPHLITMDFLIIATSDANKPLLKPAIPLMIRALSLRGEANADMVRDIVSILLQLSFEPQCLAALKEISGEIIPLLQKLVTSERFPTEVMMSSQNLQNVLTGATATPQVAAGASTRATTLNFGSLIRRVMKESPAKSSTSTGKHVMLSYNWGVKPIVQRVDAMLRENGLRTWIDE